MFGELQQVDLVRNTLREHAIFRKVWVNKRKASYSIKINPGTSDIDVVTKKVNRKLKSVGVKSFKVKTLAHPRRAESHVLRTSLIVSIPRNPE